MFVSSLCFFLPLSVVSSSVPLFLVVIPVLCDAGSKSGQIVVWNLDSAAPSDFLLKQEQAAAEASSSSASDQNQEQEEGEEGEEDSDFEDLVVYPDYLLSHPSCRSTVRRVVFSPDGRFVFILCRVGSFILLIYPFCGCFISRSLIAVCDDATVWRWDRLIKTEDKSCNGADDCDRETRMRSRSR